MKCKKLFQYINDKTMMHDKFEVICGDHVMHKQNRGGLAGEWAGMLAGEPAGKGRD